MCRQVGATAADIGRKLSSDGRNPQKASQRFWHLKCTNPPQSDVGTESRMLSQCANSQCSKRFLRLGQGKLFLVEFVANSVEPKAAHSFKTRQSPRRRSERYWLCDECSRIWTLVHDGKHGVLLLPMRYPASSTRAEAEISRTG